MADRVISEHYEMEKLILSINEIRQLWKTLSVSIAVIVVFLVGMGGNFNTLGMYTDMN